jgi:hypothetical protein
MRIKRALIVPAILVLGAAGSAIAGSVMPLAVAHAPAAHVSMLAGNGSPNMVYHADGNPNMVYHA